LNAVQISRLTVTSWTSFDRRLIIPRARTVVRIGMYPMTGSHQEPLADLDARAPL
jgi:hypothetical protein